MNDTSPEIAAMVHARLMAKTGEERFLMGVRMHEAARRMVMASFPPGISDEQRKKLLFERFYGDQGSKAFASSTEIEGMKTIKDHLKAHGNNYHTTTSGPLKTPKPGC